MTTPPGPFQTILTPGGATLRDPLSGQPMHSAIGPSVEAQKIYLEPLRFDERLIQEGSPLVIWDLGMGIAANVIAALSRALSTPKARSLEIHSFENAPEGLRQASRDLEHFSFLASFVEPISALLQTGRAQIKNHRWTLHSGDFRHLLHQAPPADLIFFDLYTPKACGELWSVPVMEQLRRQSPHATLATYSAATPVRLALLLAGWWVGRPSTPGPVTALKNESTLAVASPSEKRWLENPLDAQWLEKFRHSSQAKPYSGGSQDPWHLRSFDELEGLLIQHPQFSSSSNAKGS
jgi:tRNA U34 5-methylaminomethyl-2-thiouridine-forming methyltransferase MnmC